MNINKQIMIIAPLFLVFSLHANIIWPAMFISDAIFSSWALIIVSIIIEGLCFPLFIPHIDYLKGLFMSLVGNIISALFGTIIMAFAMIGWHFVFDQFLGGTFNIINSIASIVLMCLGSALIELVALRLLFSYTFKQLAVPVFLGNSISYILVVMYKFPNDIAALWSSLFQ